MPYRHHTFGLNLEATKPIPGLVASASVGAPDVRLWLGTVPPGVRAASEPADEVWYVSPYRDQHGEPNLRAWKLAGGTHFRLLYSDGTEFIVDRPGENVWATWPEPATLEDTATYFLGPVLGFVLRLRGTVCLHASAIAVGDRAIALLGPAGAGKSTTAAALARMGYSVLSDDIVALSDRGRSFLVQPAYPRIRLWPESVGALYGRPDALPRLTPTWEKRYLDLVENGCRFQQRPLPLAAIYLLGGRRALPPAPFVEPVPAGEALVSLVANGYVNYLLDPAMRRQDFDVLGRVVASVPCSRVIPHADSERLSELCDVILHDVRTLSPSDTIGSS